ncbi:ataxin-1-like [Watersipora subatra]|uniref:ataxin-1-like n=1 Tax=Watersipora subatra TaxID=2589382 RepID=UPI00355C94CB
MNGQDRAQIRTSSSYAVTDVSSQNPEITGVVKRPSWIRDMVANPEQAAQAGLVNLHDISNPRAAQPPFDSTLRASAAVGLQQHPSLPNAFPNSFLKNFYNTQALTAASTGELPQHNLQLADPNRLLLPCVTSSNDSPSVTTAFYSNSTKRSKAFQPAESEVAAKRMKIKLGDSSALLPSQVAQQPCQPSIPHRPAYFHRGSIIQLDENRLKKIEDLQTSDFEYSASISPDLSLDSSTVVKISEDRTRGTAFLTFSVGDNMQKPLEATVEATLEHPFFVFGQGWSSVKPESTLNYYKMKSQQLKVRDRCISLTLKDKSSINNNSSYGNSSGAANAEPHIPSINTGVSQSK